MRKEIRKEYNINLLPATNIITGNIIIMAGLTIDMKKRKYNSGNNN